MSAKVLVPSFHRPPQGSQPNRVYPAYRATPTRNPSKPLIFLPHTLSEITGPVYRHDGIRENDNDLTRQHAGEPLGERVIITGRVLDDNGRPVPAVEVVGITFLREKKFSCSWPVQIAILGAGSARCLRRHAAQRGPSCVWSWN